MEKTWRWFGRKDKITLPMLRQIGVEGIVSALHSVPNGEVWTPEAISAYKANIEQHGLRWSVVESLPVCEAIKYGGPERERLLANYRTSLRNLGEAGVRTVCYNFMPVIDWIRTDLEHLNPDGTINAFREKSDMDSDLINIGFMVLEPSIFDLIEGDSDSLERHPIAKMVKAGEVNAYIHTGFWQCMDTMREKEKLEKLWKAGNAPWKIWED